MPKVHVRKQVMFHLDIASSKKGFNSSHQFMQYVAGEVSKVVGGCTLIDSVGYWADVEQADRDSYNDVAIGVENNVQLQVKGEVDKEDRLTKAIVNSVTKASNMWPSLGVNWVCGLKITSAGNTVAFNFSVRENI